MSRCLINILPFIWVIFCFHQVKAQRLHNELIWDELPPLPPSPGQTHQPGLAGAFAGVHNNVLILAGGANFPAGKPWEGGNKVYHDEIYVLKRSENVYRWITDSAFHLPYPIAYGASVSVPGGVVCIGGMNSGQYVNTTLLLTWDAVKKAVLIDSLPALPIAMANMAAAASGNTLYVAGGSTADGPVRTLYALDLNLPASGWKRLPDVPAAPFSHAVAAVQSNGEYPCFYLFGGRSATASGISALYHHSFVYDPVKASWKALADIQVAGQKINLSAGTAIASGANNILLIGGDDGDVFHQIETLTAQANQSHDMAEQKKINRQLSNLRNNHPGFSRKIYLYNTLTDAWTVMAALPFGSQVTTTAVHWGDRLVIPSGEVSPGIRTNKIRTAVITKQEYFTWLDYSVLLVYLCLMVLIGFWTSGRQNSTDDYFKGGQRIPGWAAGLSIFGTQLSAITFMAIPAKTYATNWNYFFLLMTIIMVMPFIIRYFIPFFRKLNVTTSYEYLEKRFNYTTRFLAASLYILLQVGRLAIVLLLPSIALTLVMGIDVGLCILIMGAITIFYTVMGGIEAVIWTDVAQVIILLGGALLCIILIPVQLDESFMGAWQTVQEYHKLAIFDFRFTLEESTFWVVIIGGIAINIVTYGSDQTVVQRYLTTKDEKTAVNSLRIGAWMTLPAALLFFSIGTLLFLFYREYPREVNINLESQDAIFPWYIVSQLPQGISGLLIAAIFSAAMSTLSSSINSVSTAFINDFYKRFAQERPDKSYLLLARVITVVVGVIGTGVALLMARWGIASLWDQFNLILGLFTGGIGAVFLLGIFSRKANAHGVVVGLVLSGVVQYFVKEYTSLNLLLYAFTGCASCLVFGYLFSIIFPREVKNLQGLTIHTLQVKEK